jgi:WD40 repeat protein
VAISVDRRLALSGSHDRTVKLWSIGTGDEVSSAPLAAFTADVAVYAVALSRDGRFAAAGDLVGNVHKFRIV